MTATLNSPTLETRWPWLIATILYGSTLYFSSNVLLLLLLLILPTLINDIRVFHRTKSTLLIVGFVAAGVINAALGAAFSGGHGSEGLRALFTIPLVLVTIYLSRVLDDFEVRKAIYVFILLECAVGIVQFYFDAPHPFPGQFTEVASADYSDLSGFEALYFNRACGLSSSSSVFAQKIFILVLMFLDGDFRRFKTSVRALFICLIAGGLLSTFNRTVIIVLMFFVILWLVRSYAKTWKSVLAFLAPAVALFAAFSYTYVVESVREALSFGVTAGGLDSRFLIWEDAFSFISKHLWWGNNSMQILFDYYGSDNHAHNSFLQMIATHGVFIAMLLFLFVLVNISRSNFPAVIALILYSLTQYGIFWAISFVDMVFYYYLVTRSRPFAWPDARSSVAHAQIQRPKPPVDLLGSSATT